MRAIAFGTTAIVAAHAATARAQLPPPEAASDAPNAGSNAGSNLSGAPNPTSLSPAGNPSDWRFTWHGFLRAPLRVGVGRRPPCAPGAAAGAEGATSSYNGPYCAGPGQSSTTFHTPYVPDDQSLAWTYDRQWEPGWTEVFFSFGNNRVVGTVGIMGYDLSDASFVGGQPDQAQFGIGQAWVTVTPELPIGGLRLNWKVGEFWDKFGMAGRYDGGHYDTYMIGRTHQIGESLTLEYAAGDLTFQVTHGFGAHLEMVPTGISLTGSSNALNYVNTSAGNAYPPSASPGFTLLHHVHLRVSYKKRLDLKAHYMTSWAQDDREQGTQEAGLGGGTQNAPPTAGVYQGQGSLSVLGAEARITAGSFGELYVGYSHIDAKNVTQVGPAIEVVHSQGGGGHSGANGIYENFFNGVGTGNGQIDSVQAEYDLGLAALIRKWASGDVPFWENGGDVRLALFMMYSTVSTGDATSTNLLTGRPTNGTQKLKYGADLVANVLPWLGIGARGDVVEPDSHDSAEAFGVLSPKLVFRTQFVTHEEITAQYSHYWYRADVRPQQWLGLVGVKNIGPGGTAGVPYPSDEDVFGIKCTLWW
jgi:hypothetical protein